MIDAQLPPALASIIAAGGHDARHVGDVGLRDAEDTSIWRYALEQNAVIVTKDEDFAVRSLRSGQGPVIVWLRVGNTSRRAVSEWLVPLLPQIINLTHQGERLIEVR